jgi:hypothetical protein
MRPDCVEVTPPALDNDLGLSQRVEDFTIEQFITQAGIKTPDVAVLPGANLRAVQLLLGHTKIESTVRYLGIEVDDAPSIAE